MQRAGSILSLFAAEEVPAAMITFVSLLLFLQTGNSPALSVCFSSLLFLPWVLKSFLREKVRRRAHFRRALQWSELLLVVSFAILGLGLNPSMALFQYLGQTRGSGVGLFVLLFLVSLLTAWHELAARMYYERMLRPQLQRLYNGPKIFVSQFMVVLTYGLLIIFVGTLQVLFRSIYQAWSMAMLLTALGISLFFLLHLFVLKPCPVGDNSRHATMLHAMKAELHIIERIRRRPHWHRPVFLLGVLLLPQSLMFYSRTLYFLALQEDGGLGCSLQDVGFAQGVVGVIAFCLGISLGRRMMPGRHGMESWNPQPCLMFLLTFSPFVYLCLTYTEGLTLLQLSLATFLAQFCFGLGLNACHPFVQEISGGRYRNTINYLYVPLVAAMMLLPMMISGWLCGVMGFRNFFWVDALTAPLAWAMLFIFRKYLPQNTNQNIVNEIVIK